MRKEFAVNYLLFVDNQLLLTIVFLKRYNCRLVSTLDLFLNTSRIYSFTEEHCCLIDNNLRVVVAKIARIPQPKKNLRNAGLYLRISPPKE